ncbi:hypothetical protein O6H91_05G023900 [Diphasiastrum complanatum]|uniref:Uncharacterized protein n=1 Tax=Diphasiastrum complanatum TaxID=34168 RepID=A0ACC2DMA6_DIPCM|nr:hypothetical protein O6H91_05G023900 [Diphasiastrum complanatum]
MKMDSIGVEWVDSEEWAAIELALAAAKTQENQSSCANACSLPTDSEDYQIWTLKNLPHGEASAPDIRLESKEIGAVCCIDGTHNHVDGKKYLIGGQGCVTENKICLEGLNAEKSFSTIEDPQNFAVISEEHIVMPARQDQSFMKLQETLPANAIGNENTDASVHQKLENEEPFAVDDTGISKTGKEQLNEEHATKRCKQQLTWIPLPKQSTPLPWRMSPSRCREQTKCKLPFLQFKGKVVYSTTMEEVDAAAQQLQCILSSKRKDTQDAIALGFDTEWKVVYNRREPPRKVATIQLCVDGDRSDVMQIIYSGIPTSLQKLLEDSSTCKVGLGAHGDAAKLYRDYNIIVNGVKDLSVLANQRQMCYYKQWSLSSLAQELTGKQVSKDPKIRCGDWEALPLSHQQLHYAATDAFASLLLYQVLMSFPDPVLEDEINLEPVSTGYKNSTEKI